MRDSQVVVNITPMAAGSGLREILEHESRRRGLPLRGLVGRVYTYAAINSERFSAPLKSPLRKPGAHIGATVDKAVARALGVWADREQTSRGLLCSYILEKAIELELIDKALSRQGASEAEELTELVANRLANLPLTDDERRKVAAELERLRGGSRT